MEPTSVVAVAVLLVAVLPGSIYTWAFERQVTAFGASLTDRVLRFVALSVLFHLVLGWAEFYLFQVAFRGLQDPDATFGAAQFAAAWGAVLVLFAVPYVCGSVIGGLYATRVERLGWGWLRRFVSEEREDRVLQFLLGRTPAPRAWDDLFSERFTGYLRVETVDGTAVAGLFADRSYAGGFPNDADLHLEQAWAMDDTGVLTQALDYSVYIPAGQIARMEILFEDDGQGGGTP